MDIHLDTQATNARHNSASAISPVASERVRALATRAMEGAPALTAGEMRELADAILEHNALSER